MKLQWLGEYRELVREIIWFANGYSQLYNKEILGTDIKYSFLQIQIIEHLLENEGLNEKMAEIAAQLGLTASSFTKLVKKLVDKGLLDKFHIQGNHKDIILKITDKGRHIYKEYSEQIAIELFSGMFEVGNNVPSEFIEMFSKMVGSLNSKMDLKGKEPIILVPMKNKKDV